MMSSLRTRTLMLLLLTVALFVSNLVVQPGEWSFAKKPRKSELSGPVYPFYRLEKSFRVRPINTNDNRRVILLTFDDTPASKKTTLSILNTLDRHRVRAFFYVNGYLIKSYPNLLREIHRRGHEIGNHTYSHANLTRTSPVRVESEIDIVQRQVRKVAGFTPRFFRAPYGEYDQVVLDVLADKKITLMSWSDDSEDWKTRNQPSQAMKNRVLNQLRPGSILLLHDVPGTAQMLDELLLAIKKRGYTFVQPGQLLGEVEGSKK